MWVPWRPANHSSSTVSAHQSTNKKPDPPPTRAASSSTSSLTPSDFFTKIRSTPPEVLVTFFLFGSLASFGGAAAHRRYFKRLQNGGWVTPDMIKRKQWIRGYVTDVGDADNFRLYHTPAFGWRWPTKFRRIPTTTKELTGQTISIRLAGVDAPELGHFGNPVQPGAKEAQQWLKDAVLNRFVYCQLLQKDQYARIVADVYLAPRILPGSIFYGSSVGTEFVKAGWAHVYKQSGAVYGRSGIGVYERAEQEAITKRRGIWKNGPLQVESPAEYKKKYRTPSSVEL